MMRLTFILLVCLPASSTASTRDAGAVRVRALTLDGRKLAGVVREWRLSGDLTIETSAGKTVRVPTSEVDRIDFAAGAKTSPTGTWVIESAGGIRLTGEIVGGDDRSITINHALLEKVEMPIERLVRISRRTRDARVPRSRDGSEDTAILANGDSVSGVMARVTGQSVVFSDGAGEREIRLDVLEEVIIADTNRTDKAGLRALIELRDGAELMAEELSWKGGSLEATLPGGQRVKIDPGDLSYVEVAGGRRDWLGAMRPVSYEFTPYFDRSWPYRVDANVTGGPLVLRGRTYRRGIGLHSACRISWDLAGRYTRFSAWAGIDDSGGRYADADLIVRVDGREVQRFKGLRVGAEPRAINLSIENAKTLTIEVEFGLRGDVQDRVNLVDAALFRKQ